MRLLDTGKFILKEFLEEEVPPYVILSHTWDEEEVLFADIRNRSSSAKKGWRKITGACDKAQEYGFAWIWIDTCCIDKSSSAELSEAINSMFKWYKASQVCYVYLQDIGAESDVFGSFEYGYTDFPSSRWFSRGWTLQELIAPTDVRFYAADWVELGTRRSLANRISQKTKIPLAVLNGGDPYACSVVERMSWAAQRETTRREDEAYCLLGLFRVNMPLLYGEGRAAFQRLQKQILSEVEDYSLLTWCHQTTGRSRLQNLRGCLATHPGEFTWLPTCSPSVIMGAHTTDSNPAGTSGSINMESVQDDSLEVFLHSYASLVPQVRLQADTEVGGPPSVTSRGLRLELPVLRHWSHPLKLTLAWLYCECSGKLVCILLERQGNMSRAIYARKAADVVFLVDSSHATEFELQEIYLLYDVNTTQEERRPLKWLNGTTLTIRAGSPKGPSFRVIHSRPTLRRGGEHTVKRPYHSYILGLYPRDGLWILNVFEVSHVGHDAWVIVACGSYGDRLWCNIKVESNREAAIEWSDRIITEFPDGKESQGLQPDALTQLGIDSSRDRDVKILPLQQFDLCTVSIDEKVTDDVYDWSEYHLKVRFDNRSQCEPWARLVLDS